MVLRAMKGIRRGSESPVNKAPKSFWVFYVYTTYIDADESSVLSLPVAYYYRYYYFPYTPCVPNTCMNVHCLFASPYWPFFPISCFLLDNLLISSFFFFFFFNKVDYALRETPSIFFFQFLFPFGWSVNCKFSHSLKDNNICSSRQVLHCVKSFPDSARKKNVLIRRWFWPYSTWPAANDAKK